jgi:FkbM family methyltransferase
MNPPPGITALPNGQWVLVHDTHLSRWAEQHGNIISDPHVHAWLRPYIDRVDMVFDIGSNIGDHTRAYLDLGKQVIAFEPNPLAFACLAHNCPEATNLNIAASDEAGVLRFSVSENVGASRITEDGELFVAAEAIDGLGLPPPGFVKIDVEGHEIKVLQGMKQTLRDHHPMVFVEINRGALEAQGFNANDIPEFMEDIGYSRMILYPEDAQWSMPQFDALFLP